MSKSPYQEKKTNKPKQQSNKIQNKYTNKTQQQQNYNKTPTYTKPPSVLGLVFF